MEDFMATNWWLTTSGTNDSWTEDYTRSRGSIQSTTYTSPDDLIGRTKTGREIDNGILNP